MFSSHSALTIGEKRGNRMNVRQNRLKGTAVILAFYIWNVQFHRSYDRLTSTSIIGENRYGEPNKSVTSDEDSNCITVPCWFFWLVATAILTWRVGALRQVLKTLRWPLDFIGLLFSRVHSHPQKPRRRLPPANKKPSNKKPSNNHAQLGTCPQHPIKKCSFCNLPFTARVPRIRSKISARISRRSC